MRDPDESLATIDPKAIRSAVAARGLKMKWLAAKAGIGQTTLRAALRGTHKRMKLKNAKGLALALELPLLFIVKREKK